MMQNRIGLQRKIGKSAYLVGYVNTSFPSRMLSIQEDIVEHTSTINQLYLMGNCRVHHSETQKIPFFPFKLGTFNLEYSAVQTIFWVRSHHFTNLDSRHHGKLINNPIELKQKYIT